MSKDKSKKNKPKVTANGPNASASTASAPNAGAPNTSLTRQQLIDLLNEDLFEAWADTVEAGVFAGGDEG